MSQSTTNLQGSFDLTGHSLGNGRYEVLEQVGAGGMATVYKAHDTHRNCDVAIKVLPRHPAQDQREIERFHREAQTVARLSHPHILPFYDEGSQPDLLYLVMLYVAGGSLKDYFKKPLSLQEVVRLLEGVGQAVDYAHSEGVFHRDIKPANILLDNGFTYLADFGIAKFSRSTSTLTGIEVIGTPLYMPPEQAVGTKIDGRSDVYALGVVVYELLTGQTPYRT